MNEIVYTTESQVVFTVGKCVNPEHERDDYGCLDCWGLGAIKMEFK